MENVRIAVLSAYDKVCAFLDNGAPSALHYYGDELHSYREGSACTYGFKASARHGDAQYLVEGNKLAFRYGGRDYYFNIMKVVKTEYVVEVVAYSMMFELLNEDAGEYKSPKAMSFQEYLDVFDPEHTLELGVNEVEDKTVSHEWTGSSTILARIFSLANVFGAEAEFVPVLADDYSLERLVMNVYREHDGENQGIGKDRRDMTLRYGVNVKGIRKSSDITGLYTAILPVGTDNLMISALDKTELDADGRVEYRSAPGDGCIRAVQAMERFPSNLKTDDRYILKRWSYDTANVNVLYGQALAELKKVCVPQVSYEVDGFFDTEMGDTVVVTDEEFVPALYLEARVTEQVRSLTDPAQNKTTFDNFHELKSQVDTSLLDKMNQLIREYKVYACVISTDNGIVFKNGEGTTTLTANVRDAGADVADLFTIVWMKDGVELAVGKSIVVNAGDVSGKAVYTQGVRYAYWAAGATVVFTYDGANWRVASEPVYANTVTVGNAASGHIFIDSDSVDFMSGSSIFASLLNDSNCAHLHSIRTLFLECMGLHIKDQSKMGVSVWSDDLILHAGSKSISLLNLAKFNSSFVSKTYANVSLRPDQWLGIPYGWGNPDQGRLPGDLWGEDAFSKCGKFSAVLELPERRVRGDDIFQGDPDDYAVSSVERRAR